MTTVETSSGNNAIFTLVTTANQLQVNQANDGIHTITELYARKRFPGQFGNACRGLHVTRQRSRLTSIT